MPQPHAPRALLITTDFPPDIGGLQTYAFRIVRDLPNGLLKHALIGSDHPEALPSPNPVVKITKAKGRDRWSAFFWSMRHVLGLRLRGEIDFQVHMQWSTAVPSLLLKLLGSRSRYLVLVHGAELLDPGRSMVNFLKGLILAKADAVVSGSAYTAEILAQQGRKCNRIEIIHYGNPLEGATAADAAMASETVHAVDPAHPLDAAKAGDSATKRDAVTPMLLCMHRLVARKGTALLLDALSRLQEIPWTLLLVGQGEEESRLRERVATLGLDTRVTFRPPVADSEKIALMSQAALFILPSLPPDGNNFVEGLGLTLLEAQSLGTPVLAARTGGIPEALREGETGALFRAGDAEDLQSRLAELLHSPGTLERMGRAGPEWVRNHFSWKTGLAKLAGLMTEIASAEK